MGVVGVAERASGGARGGRARARVGVLRAHLSATKSQLCTPNMFLDSICSKLVPWRAKSDCKLCASTCRHASMREATSAVSACLTSSATSSCAGERRGEARRGVV
jgi:hypothetical protein